MTYSQHFWSYFNQISGFFMKIRLSYVTLNDFIKKYSTELWKYFIKCLFFRNSCNFKVFSVTLEQKCVKCAVKFSPKKTRVLMHINLHSQQLFLCHFSLFYKSYVNSQFLVGGVMKKYYTRGIIVEDIKGCLHKKLRKSDFQILKICFWTLNQSWFSVFRVNI